MYRLLAAIAALCLSPSIALAWSQAEMNRAIDQTNFLVNNDCSGTLIDKAKGFVLTAEHCITSQYQTITKEVIDEDGKIETIKVRRVKDGTVSQLDFVNGDAVRTVTYKVKVVATDKNTDLALLKITAPIPNVMESVLACHAPNRGDVAWIIGNPMGNLYSSVGKGLVSSVQRNYDTIAFGSSEQAKEQLMQVSAGIVGGNSGGAVYDADGKLIGVPVITSRMNEILGYAVPLAVIREFLTKHDSAIAALQSCGEK